MNAVLATPAPIAVEIRPASPGHVRMVQATWSREMQTRWKHRTRLPGDKPGVPPSLACSRGELEERSGVHIGKVGYDMDANRHEPLVLSYNLWVRAHHLLVDDLIATGSIVVAMLPTDPDPVGWAAFSGSTLHFVYVMPVARRSTIATQLVLSTRCSAASHMTPDGRGLVRHLRGEAAA